MPAVGLDLAGQHAKAGGLAGAIGADQSDNFAGLHKEGHAVHGAHASKGFGQAFRRKQRAHSPAPRCGCSAAGTGASGSSFEEPGRNIPAMEPTMPLGNNTTSPTMPAPSTSFE